MAAVRFSVLIPTRERAETLRFALRTCLDQPFDDYEIVVSDNCSSPATKAVVDAAGAPKVRYVRTAGSVAMSDNWEFAVAQARGEYVLLIGDDDGLLPHALGELDRLIRETGARAVRWDTAFYTWPDVALPGQGDYLMVPFGRGLTECDAGTVIREVAAFRAHYSALPMLYNAVVHRDLLAGLRDRAGRVFPHPIPDVYSGFAVGHAAGRFFSTAVPMTVSGQSGFSNGIAALANGARNAIGREFHELNRRAGLRSEPTVPALPVMMPYASVADTFTFAKRALFPNLPAEVDRKTLSRECLNHARVSEAEWPAALAAVRGALADTPALQAWFDAELAATPYRERPPIQLRPPKLGLDDVAIHLDAATFGVFDVAGAARLCDRVLSYRSRPVNYARTESSSQAVAPRPADLGAGCDERERAILRLHSAVDELQQTVCLLQRARAEREDVLQRLDVHARSLASQVRSERRWSLKLPLRAVRRLLSVRH